MVRMIRAAMMLGRRTKMKPMNSVQIAEALLQLDGPAALVEFFSSGRMCDAVPVQCVLLKMFPDASFEDLAAGLQLAVTIARLDMAEIEAIEKLRPRTA